jgi:hypothetical protein
MEEDNFDSGLIDFVEYGYYYARNVFDPSIAANCRDILWKKLEEFNIFRDNPSSWIKKQPISEIYTFDSDPWRYLYFANGLFSNCKVFL